MKKLIVTIICVLFASTSFAQIVGASSIAKQSAPKTTLGVKKHEFSIHGGLGVSQHENPEIGFSIEMKYKYKPFDKYNIRLLGEIGTAFSHEGYREGLSIIPVMAGINYEYRFSKSTSIWTDFVFGVSIPLSEMRASFFQDEYCFSFEPGFALSPEIGIRHNEFSFSFKYMFSMNGYKELWTGYLDDYVFDFGYEYTSNYFLFQLGYHF